MIRIIGPTIYNDSADDNFLRLRRAHGGSFVERNGEDYIAVTVRDDGNASQPPLSFYNSYISLLSAV